MIIFRIAAALMLITVFVLLGAYLITRNKKYLIALKKFVSFIAWFIVVAVILGLISRVIRF